MCREKETDTQRKSGCGCLIRVCDDCIGDKSIRHNKCIKCKGEPTPDEEKEMDRAYEDYLYPSDNYYDDLYEQDREYDAMQAAEYDRAIQEHYYDGTWDILP